MAEEHSVVPCGKCYACLSRKRSEWAFRLFQELKVSETAFFITLTYDDSKVPIHYDDNGYCKLTLCKRDIQLFMKKLRKKMEGVKIRYFLTGEYGSNTDRPHYHMLLFNAPFCSDELIKILDSTWSKGFVGIGSVNKASINYTAKYCIKKHNDDGVRENTFSLMSRKPGIGYKYVNEECEEWHKNDLKNYVVHDGGIKGSLPRYYRDKIFNEDERKVVSKMSLNVLNKKDIERKEKCKKDGTDELIAWHEGIRQYEERMGKELLKNSKL